MFQSLEPLVRAVGKLTLSLRMDGEQMIVVAMPLPEGKDAALRQPLALSALPAELDAGFSDAVQRFTGVYRSLDEQVAATTAILQAAEKTSSGKAQKALAKGGKPALPAPSASTSASDDDESGEESDDEQSGDVSTASMPPRETGSNPSGTDLSSLLL